MQVRVCALKLTHCYNSIVKKFSQPNIDQLTSEVWDRNAFSVLN